MLIEIRQVRQVDGEMRRRWFASSTMDLILWLDEAGIPSGFQLCYGKGGIERAFTWMSDAGFSHMSVDDGEKVGGLQYKATPILREVGGFDASRILALFEESSSQLSSSLRDFVKLKIAECRPQAERPSNISPDRDV